MKNENETNLIDIPLNDDLKPESLKLLDELDIPKDDINGDLMGLSGCEFGDFVSAKPPSFMPSQLLLNDLAGFDFSPENTTTPTSLLDDLTSTGDDGKLETLPTKPTNTKNAILDLFGKRNPLSYNKNESATTSGSQNTENNKSKDGSSPIGSSSSSKSNKEKLARKDMSAWFKLFAELDPLANPDAIENKIDKRFNNNSHAA